MNSLPSTPIHLAASGMGERMRPAIEAMGYGDLPKHLLPTGEPGGATLLGRNLDIARNSSRQVQVHVNRHNRQAIQGALQLPDQGMIIDPDTRPLGPFTFVRDVEPGQTGASVAGDVYIQTNPWNEALLSHLGNDAPITFLVGKVRAPVGSAVFSIDDKDMIRGFDRPTEPRDGYRNIGLYIFSLTPPVIEIIQEYRHVPVSGVEDDFFKELLKAGLVRAQLYKGTFFNTNTAEDYAQLQAHVRGQEQPDELALT